MRKLASLYPDREMTGLLTKEQLEQEVMIMTFVVLIFLRMIIFKRQRNIHRLQGVTKSFQKLR